MIKLGDNEVKEVYLGNKRIAKIYKGDEEVFNDCFVVKGKWTDDSTESNWECKVNNRITDLIPFTNPNTKEFIYEVLKRPNTIERLLADNYFIERIYSVKSSSSPTSLLYLFSSCHNLISADISNVNLNNTTDFRYAFNDCQNLEYCKVGHIVAKKVNFKGMFRLCPNLKEIIISGDIGVIDVVNAFNGIGISKLDVTYLDTSECSNFSLAFSSSKIKELTLNFDMSNATNVKNMFALSYLLENITGSISNLKISISLMDCPLTNESAMLFINGLADVDEPQTITFKATTYDTLTEEQIKIATDKNWTVARA